MNDLLHIGIQTAFNVILIALVFPRRKEFHELVARVTRLVLNDETGITTQVPTVALNRLAELLIRPDATIRDIHDAAEELIQESHYR